MYTKVKILCVKKGTAKSGKPWAKAQFIYGNEEYIKECFFSPDDRFEGEPLAPGAEVLAYGSDRWPSGLVSDADMSQIIKIIDRR